MGEISPQLKEVMNAAGQEVEMKLDLIISLLDKANWDEGVCLLQEAGLQIDSKAKEIRTVAGKAKITAIQRIAEVPAVMLIEIDELASTMD